MPLSVVLALRAVDGAASQSPLSNADKESTAAATRHGGKFPPIQNVMSFRRSFPDRWGEYLRETYRTAYAVQRAFPGIDSKTARDWISGKRDPSGSFVAIAIEQDPDAIAILGRSA